ncbi:hypothetical protein BaRGS_00028444 [Batillaria attramentaria]|uniref:Anaphase-promoting complex subunit 5 n=1 Tax=Batillaria attramentaria TaxID=370345 RepID=A0ABD0JYX7_9CAEN
MASPKEDFLAMGPFVNSQLSKEQITPHKLSLLVLVHEYQVMRGLIIEDSGNHETPEVKFSEREKRFFMTTLLDLLQCPDLELRDLKAKLTPVLRPKLVDNFMCRLLQFKEEGTMAVMDFVEALGSLVLSDSVETIIHRTSVVGIFIRRLWLSFSQLSFSQLCDFHGRLKAYFYSGEAELVSEIMDSLGPSLADSISSLAGEAFLQNGLRPLDLSTDSDKSGLDGAFFSRKQAEFFIAQQAQMLSHDENKALSACKLQDRITGILQANPDLAEAHFLSYLNSLRVKEYCTAVHNLHHYFDRNSHLTGETTGGNKKLEEEVSRRYAALNLAALHFQFGHKTEARAALLEAVRMAQETNDHVCLQHALAWLNLLTDTGNGKTATQMERSVAKSGELSLPYLTSLGVQMLARHNALATATPSSVFDYLMKSSVINCQHSLYAMMSISGVQRSALWSYYGNRECAAMCAQIVLCLDTAEGGIFYNGESVCMALCLLARHHFDRGAHSCATEILQHARQRFPPHTQHAHLWQECEQYVNFEQALLAGRWTDAERAAKNLRALNESEGRLHLATLLRERGEVTASLDMLHELRELCEGSKELAPDFLCRVLLGLAEVFVVTGNHTAALPHLTQCVTHANNHHLHYLSAMATLYLAVVQMRMQLPGQALRLLETRMLTVLTHGSAYDRARLIYAYARCKVAAVSDAPTEERKTALYNAASLMSNVVVLFQSREANQRVKDAVYYQARLYHQLGYTAERNRCAHRFKQMDQQSPTLSVLAVNAI